MDFWPGGTSVPKWARDASEVGVSRKLDLPCRGSKLKGDSNPPFTCGSETRRSLIKYFVRRYINEGGTTNQLVQKLVRQQVKRLRDAWSNPSNFLCECTGKAAGTRGFSCCKMYDPSSPDNDMHSCLCADGTTYDDQCCTNNFLPSTLDIDYDNIPSADILEAIVSKMAPYLRDQVLSSSRGAKSGGALREYTSPAELQSWNWEHHNDGAKAVDTTSSDGLYASHRPILKYDATESASPFKDDKTIWDMCTGLVSQVIFTLPLLPDVAEGGMWTASTVPELDSFTSTRFDFTLPRDFAGTPSAKDDGLSMLELYIQKLLAHAFQRSPLYWHHALRHVPSDSLVCQGQYKPTQHRKVSAKIQLVKNVAATLDIPQTKLTQFVLHGYSAFALGSVLSYVNTSASSECFCGWSRSVASTGVISCTVPDQIAVDLALEEEDFVQGSPEYAAIVAQVQAVWPTLSEEDAESWECPEMELSDAWGGALINVDRLRDWVLADQSTTLQVDVTSLLTHGTAGVRLGNVDTLKNKARAQGVFPSARVHHLASAVKGGEVSLRRCETVMRASNYNSNNLIDEVVDDLFPMAQGVTESQPVSTCLRFAIEYARYHAGTHVLQTPEHGQQQVYQRWRRRCEVQLQTLGVCKTHGVLQIIPKVQHEVDCPFKITDSYEQQTFYVTPGCLVYIKAKVIHFDI